MKTIFVYGTLRPGEFNDLRMDFSENAEVIARDCQANGRMYNLHGVSPIYPVVNFDEAGMVRGDLLSVDETHDRFRSIDKMECRAGYTPRTIKVMKPNGEMVEAYAYHYDTSKRFDLGVLIDSGNWLEWSGRG